MYPKNGVGQAPPSDLCVILHQFEHLARIGQPKLPGAVLLQGMQLASGDLVPLDGVRFGVKRAYILDRG